MSPVMTGDPRRRAEMQSQSGRTPIPQEVVGLDNAYFIQKNELGWRDRTLVHPENESWTCFEQSASVNVTYPFGFETIAENIGMRQNIANIQPEEVIEFYLKELMSEGVTSFPRWITSTPNL